MDIFMPWRRPAVTQNDAEYEIIDIPDDLPDDSSTFGVESLPDTDSDVVSLASDDTIEDSVHSQEHSPCTSWLQNYIVPPYESDQTCEPVGSNDDHWTIPRKDAIACEQAGRGDVNHKFHDLRSPSKAIRRRQTRNAKYRGFRAVNPGQAGSEHHVQVSDDYLRCWPRDLPAELPVQTMNKKELYQTAQSWPAPPVYHRGRKHRSRWDSFWSFAAERRHKEAKQQPDLVSEGLEERLDFENELWWVDLDIEEEKRWKRERLVNPVHNGLPDVPRLSLGELLKYGDA